MKKLLIIVMLACVSMSLIARINETKDECVKRYGQPTKEYNKILKEYAEDSDCQIFSKNGFVLVVEFYKDKADRILFYKLDSGGNIYKFEDDELFPLLDSNLGINWVTKINGHIGMLFLSANKLVEAFYSKKLRVFDIYTIERNQRKNIEKIEETQKKMNGF